MTRGERCGLTLIEVLAGLILLTLTSTACISILRDARTQVDATMTLDHALHFDLGLLADAIVADPANHDLVLDADTDTTTVWPTEYGHTGVVRVRAVPHDDRLASDASPASARAWLEFSTRDVSVVRWIAVADEGGAP